MEWAFLATIRKSGDSSVITIPIELMEEAKLEAGQTQQWKLVKKEEAA